MIPVYKTAYESGILDKLIDTTGKLLASCAICPRKCGVNRLKDEKGFCRTGLSARIYSFMPHHGEEPPLSGTRGSGTIFFSECNMRCVYCQNFEFSQSGKGREVDAEELSDIMISLQSAGCHNINFVTPTHVMPQILAGLKSAIGKGLHIPLVYNTGGYELSTIIALLEHVVDIYLPDMRYGQEESAQKYSEAPDYPKHNQGAVKEMHRQVGIPGFNEQGVIERGLIIRHLVLPHDISGTEKTMKFLSEEVSRDAYVSLMSQYMPYYRANEYTHMCRRITEKEYGAARNIMEKYGLHNGWIQEGGGMEKLAGVHIEQKLK